MHSYYYPLSKEDTLVWDCLNYADGLEQRIPFSWYKLFRRESAKGKKDKPYLNAIIILADLRYWYTPVLQRQQQGGELYRKKFRGDIFQRNYKQLENEFGLTPAQSKDALQYLEDMGVARRIFRPVAGEGGSFKGTEMYIAYYAEAVRDLELEMAQETAVSEPEQPDPDDAPEPAGSRDSSCGKAVDNSVEKPSGEIPPLGTDRGNFPGGNSAPTGEISPVYNNIHKDNLLIDDDDGGLAGEKLAGDDEGKERETAIFERVRMDCLQLGFSDETAVVDLVQVALGQPNYEGEDVAAIILSWARHAQRNKAVKNPAGFVISKIGGGVDSPDAAYRAMVNR